MAMFTYNHVVSTHRSEAVEAVAQRQLMSLVVLHRALEAHQERIGEDLSRRGSSDEQRSSQALQPHVRAVADGG